MIGSLNGNIKAMYAPFTLIEVAGVGYEVETPLTTFCELKENTQVFLWTHLVVREDAHLLYGFLTNTERNVFRVLIKINGVGAKLAIAMLSNMSVACLAQAVEMGDAPSLTKIPGIGKKTAERLVIELRDKLAQFDVGDQDSTVSKLPASQLELAEQEAVAALQSLGYSAKEAERATAMAKAQMQQGADVQSLIRSALKQLAA